MTLRYQEGFTLIELLIVVAIIGLIAAIAVPNLLMALQRSKVSRTLAEIRTILTALHTYTIDHNHYPISTNFTSLVDVVNAGGLSTYYRGPVEDTWGMPFRYRTDATGSAYMIKSFGPNQVHNNTTGDFEDPATWVGPDCTNLSFQNLNAIVERGCDIVFLNGVLAEKFD
ncbi:prepilin-type N-terminal cleavage/methylation domain-containing protein [candidate division KSB3 bacterium]|uniref:Prepilin-type N-terminal cleavage/methylation domain-containing protein n=1 Tax=candidate division KSB3 bacterium TaxID=2044937 RepID=A0A9D5JUG2_9BACT|nr:prepilin-type N-terminal cleavage/methylation domain-containing protein [candidate division KSB3 bacterium]MBD3324334.1 prepilin-type N-terminal cleavage/methylation domain-containing protein [candidate division KSB3 bacterium]